MLDIDWNQFLKKNKNYRDAFEDLCYFLFCREHRIDGGLNSYKNHPGLETEPAKVEGKYIGFQAKFFDHKIDGKQILDSIKTAISYNDQLNHIQLYINIDPGHRAKWLEDVKKLETQEDIQICLTGPKKLKILLNKPVNIDLAVFYFGEADIIKYSENSIDRRALTLINSSSFIELSLSFSGGANFNLKQEVLNGEKNIYFLVGTPASGKSILIQKLFAELCGLDSTTREERHSIIENRIVPMIVNLRACTEITLENLIEIRKSNNKIAIDGLKFIYLFDGLDELIADKAEDILFFIQELMQRSDTHNILISCRSGNHNLGKAKIYLDKVEIVNIDPLKFDSIVKYFNNKGDKEKQKCLEELQQESRGFVNEIKDVLLVQVLWDNIEDVNKKTPMLDLLEKRCSFLLNSPNHKKDITKLNLPEPKDKEIISINQNISSFFQKQYQFRFSIKELQELLLNLYVRLDYEGINHIISYLATTFFDRQYGDDYQSLFYIYQHRRYQEYFFIQYLKTEYEEQGQPGYVLNAQTPF